MQTQDVTNQNVEPLVTNEQGTQTDAVTVAPTVDTTVGQTPVVENSSQAGTAIGESIPQEAPTEKPTTPIKEQGTEEVGKNSVTVSGQNGNEFGNWEEQYKAIRPKLNQQGEELKSAREKLAAVEAEANEMRQWIEQYSPILDNVLGENADPAIKEKLLATLPSQELTPNAIQEMMRNTIQTYEAQKEATKKAEEAKKAQDEAYNKFMSEREDIRNNPLLVTKLLQTVTTERLPLTYNGLKAAASLMGVTEPVVNNQEQEKVVQNAVLTGGAASGVVGESGAKYMFNLNKIRP